MNTSSVGPSNEKPASKGVDAAASGSRPIVPAHVSVCPECGGALWWEANAEDDFEDLSLDCENEPDVDSDDESEHRHLFSEWMPVCERVRKWLRDANK